MAATDIELEAFTPELAEQQVLDVVALAQAEAAWLRSARPQTLRNFHNRAAGREAVVRLLGARTLQGSVIRKGGVAAGLATITSQLRIYNPEPKLRGILGPGNIIIGDQVDYWTDGDCTEDDHRTIAGRLLGEAATPTRLAILSARERERALGIPMFMDPVGQPGRVRVPPLTPRYGLRDVTEPLQVYVSRVTTPHRLTQ